MVNWGEYKITSKETKSDYIRFNLNNWVEYSDDRKMYISCYYTQPFTEWEGGDKVKIDNEKTSKNRSDISFSFYDNIIFMYSSHWEDKYQEAVREKNNLETERNEWRTKFYSKNRDYEEWKEKYEDAQEELDKLKNERLRETRENANERLRQQGIESTLRVENTRLQERLESASSRLIEAKKETEDTKTELSVVRREKDNQLAIFENKLDQKQQLLENVRQALKDLEIKHEKEKAEKNAEVKEKDSELKEKEKELKRKEEEVKNSQKQAKQSQEELLSERLRLKYGKLEIFANQIGINLQQVSDLCRYCERLVHARKSCNKTNIETHEDNITKIREGLRQRGFQIKDVQKFCDRCEKIAKMRVELSEVRQQQQQYQVQQEVPYNNRIN